MTHLLSQNGSIHSRETKGSQRWMQSVTEYIGLTPREWKSRQFGFLEASPRKAWSARITIANVNGSVRLESAAVLAMQGNVEDVEALLFDPHYDIRKTAREYVGFNPRLDEIVEHVTPPYPDVVSEYLTQESRTKKDIEHELASAPLSCGGDG